MKVSYWIVLIAILISFCAFVLKTTVKESNQEKFHFDQKKKKKKFQEKQLVPVKNFLSTWKDSFCFVTKTAN